MYPILILANIYQTPAIQRKLSKKLNALLFSILYKKLTLVNYLCEN